MTNPRLCDFAFLRDGKLQHIGQRRALTSNVHPLMHTESWYISKQVAFNKA